MTKRALDVAIVAGSVAIVAVLTSNRVLLISAFAQTQPATRPPTEGATAPLKSDCSPSANELRKLVKELRASNGDNNDFIRALDKAVLPGVAIDPMLSGVVIIRSTDDVFISATFPYGSYRQNLLEALRKREPIESALIPLGVQVSVSPSKIDSPDIIRIIVERDGKEATPIADTLKPTEMTTRLGAKAVIHSGTVLYSCSAFAPGATVTVTAIPKSGANFTKTISSQELAKLK